MKLIPKVLKLFYIAIIDNINPVVIYAVTFFLSLIGLAIFMNYRKQIYFENEPYLLFFTVILPVTFYIITIIAATYRQRVALIQGAKEYFSGLASMITGFLYIAAGLLGLAVIASLIWGGISLLSGLSVTTLLVIIILILILKK